MNDRYTAAMTHIGEQGCLIINYEGTATINFGHPEIPELTLLGTKEDLVLVSDTLNGNYEVAVAAIINRLDSLGIETVDAGAVINFLPRTCLPKTPGCWQSLADFYFRLTH